MEGVKQKLAALRSEENDLQDRICDLDVQIKSARDDNDKIQLEIQGLRSTEMLLKLKLESGTSRLNATESKLLAHTRLLSSSERELHSLDTATDDPISRMETLETELNSKRQEVQTIDAQYDEVRFIWLGVHPFRLLSIISIWKLTSLKRRLEQRQSKSMSLFTFYLIIIRSIAELEEQYSSLKRACDKAEDGVSQDDAIENLEVQLKDVQQRLETVTQNYEAVEREVSRLDRLISACKGNLQKQRNENELLKREFEELASI
ncbi:hypothetical protein P879_06984 [Paragonimus westermani]|uniref:Uncharacterized protein n=1 Tax=Paragonimus westermani TaxID=34504 RepID=A0A8T0D2K2_9TREM|nr:hypothetical protein P879_06984 [Paragonimus westermani]